MPVPLAAVPLFTVAAGMSLSIPAVVEYFRTQKGIDISGYKDDDLVPLEVLFPEEKKFKTYEDSFYTPKPVTGNTDLSGIVLQTKKDDDEKVTTIDQEGNVLPDLPDQMPQPDPEDNDRSRRKCFT
jgi:hypothetical protein